MEEISIKSLLNYYLERIKLIGIITLIFLAVGVVYTVINRPKYVSESTITITGDLNAAKNQSTIYADQVVNNTVLQTVISNLELNTTVKNLKKSITAKSESTSDSIYITVENVSSKKAMEINAELNKVFMNYCTKTYGNKNINLTADATITGGGIVKKYAKQIAVITLAGFIAGICYVFIRFYFDSSIKSEDDIKSLKLNIYGVIPKDKESKLYNESYNTIISNIITKSLDIDDKVILITSVDESSNKDETVYDLANEYSNLNKKVLIIDADLKNNKVSELYKLKSKEGYTDLINSKSKKIDTVITKTKNKSIDVITNGTKTINAVEVISSKKNKTVINTLKEKYDVIIIDAPVAIETSGTDVLSTYSNINLLVASNGISKINEIKDVLDKYNNINGIIVNNVNTKLNCYSSYYTKNYYNK